MAKATLFNTATGRYSLGGMWLDRCHEVCGKSYEDVESCRTCFLGKIIDLLGTFEACNQKAESLWKASQVTRQIHVNNVMAKCRRFIPFLTPEEIEDLMTAAFFHDVGYLIDIDPVIHPVVGAEWSQAFLYPIQVTNLIMTHSYADILLEKAGHDFSAVRKIRLNSPPDFVKMYNILTYCDLTIDPLGNEVSLKKRTQDMITRYGSKSPTAQWAETILPLALEVESWLKKEGFM